MVSRGDSYTESANVHLHEFKINVDQCRSKLERQVPISQTSAAWEHHHRLFPKIQLGEEIGKLAGTSMSGARNRLRRSSHLRDRVALHPLMPDGMVEDRRDDIA